MHTRWILGTTAGVAGAAALGLGGCGRPAGVLFDPANSAMCWPPPPDEPRIRYVGALHGAVDLKPAVGGAEALGQFLFGKEAPPEMVSPIGVCTDGGDRLFVADSNAQVVHVMDLGTRRYAQWKPPEKVARFTQPVGVAYDAGEGGAGGRLLVSDAVAGVIFVFDASGGYQGTVGESLLQRPCGLTVDRATRKIYVADPGAQQVVVLNADGSESARIGGRGSGPGEFNYPTYTALDSAGRLYVSDSLNFRVQVFGPDLKPIRQIGRKGDMPGYFSQPKGLALDSGDHLYVVDANFEAVQLFNTEGQLLMAFGREGRGVGEFWLPAGIFIDQSDRIWIADTYNRRIQVFRFASEATKQ